MPAVALAADRPETTSTRIRSAADRLSRLELDQLRAARDDDLGSLPATSTTPVGDRGVDRYDPTATAAAGSRSTTTTATGDGLPRTGYAVGEAVGFGLVLIGGGLLIRRRAGRA